MGPSHAASSTALVGLSEMKDNSCQKHAALVYKIFAVFTSSYPHKHVSYYSHTKMREFFKMAVGPTGKSTGVLVQAPERAR